LPNIKAAEKWVLQSEKRRLRNLSVKTGLKTVVKKARASGEAASVSLAESALDKAATKGVIHPNKAARKKSRLAKAVRAGTAVAPVAKARAKKR
jgi:small subunit ribosomal protein S20